MMIGAWLLLGGAIVGLGLLVYWLIFLTEGVYLGKRVVIWLYDVYARRYDAIKGWSMDDEAAYIAEPFVAEIGPHRHPPLILDAAAGTGRLARAAVHADLLLDATWVLLDGSARMLTEAQRHLPANRRIYFMQHAMPDLPFPDDMFDVVTCLEALEFMPEPERALAELVRVLRPGGYLLITNRIGWISRLMPGHTWSQQKLYRLLKDLGQRSIRIRPFLVDYQWASSVKAGVYRGPGRAFSQKWIALLEELADFGYNERESRPA